MARPLATVTFVLLALGLWLFAASASWVKQDNLRALDQRIYKLYEEGKYREAIPLAEQAVATARRLHGPEDPATATSLNNLALLYQAMGAYARAEPLLEEALRLRQKVNV